MLRRQDPPAPALLSPSAPSRRRDPDSEPVPHGAEQVFHRLPHSHLPRTCCSRTYCHHRRAVPLALPDERALPAAPSGTGTDHHCATLTQRNDVAAIASGVANPADNAEPATLQGLSSGVFGHFLTLRPSPSLHVSASSDTPERGRAELESERPARDRGFESPASASVQVKRGSMIGPNPVE
jgi:hypothetical protein